MIPRAWKAFAAAALVATAGAVSGCGGSTSNGIAPPPSTPAVAFADTSSPLYVGMNASEVLPEPAAEQEAAFKGMAAAGVGLFRQTFQWNEIEPKKGEFSWDMHDRLVASAARAGITVLPVVFNLRPGEAAAPKKGVTITGTTTMNPKDPNTFAAFAALLVKRYGRGGTFWKAHADLPQHPITAWQIWNEPNLKPYWGGRPNPPEYVALLRASAKAIRAVDPKAEIVTGGIPKSKLGIPLKDYVALMGRAGAKGTFDTLAIHPYAETVDGVISGIQTARRALDRAGMPNVAIRVTESGWATSGPHSAFTVSREKQAQFTAELLTRTASIAADVKLRGVAYYGWRDVLPCPGCKDAWGWHTGLRTLADTPKPALATFTQAAANLRSAK